MPLARMSAERRAVSASRCRSDVAPAAEHVDATAEVLQLVCRYVGVITGTCASAQRRFVMPSGEALGVGWIVTSSAPLCQPSMITFQSARQSRQGDHREAERMVLVAPARLRHQACVPFSQDGLPGARNVAGGELADARRTRTMSSPKSFQAVRAAAPSAAACRAVSSTCRKLIQMRLKTLPSW